MKSNHQTYKYSNMHEHFTQLYIAGNFPCLTNVVRISGREWVPTRLSHHLNLFPLNRLYTKLAKQQTVQIHLSNLTCSFCFQCKSLHMLCHFSQSKQSLTKCNVFPIPQCPALTCTPFENQSSPVQLITLKATYLPNIL